MLTWLTICNKYKALVFICPDIGKMLPSALVWYLFRTQPWPTIPSNLSSVKNDTREQSPDLYSDTSLMSVPDGHHFC